MSIVINGGGIVGSILALMLSQLTQGDLEIFLIEQYSFESRDSIAFFTNTPQIVALSRGAYAELIKIGIESILADNSSIITQIEISECNRFSKIFIKAEDYKLSELGYVIKLHTFRKELFNFLKKSTTVSVVCPATIIEIKRKKTHTIIILNNGKQIHTKLLVASDGTYSKLATDCGIQWFRSNYQQTAITTEVITEISNFGRAFERFTVFGSLALLPLSKNLNFLIWCISDQKQKEVLKWSTNKFSYELQNIFGWRLGKILNVGVRYFYDLKLIYATSHFAHRLALIGNAAQSLHPIAGQGLNLGIRDAIILSKIIHQAFLNKVDIGDYYILNLYEKRRRVDQHRTISITNNLICLFNNYYFPLVIARNLGLFFIGNNFYLRWLLVNSMLCWKTD